MDNLVNDTNSKLQEIVANLTTIKEDYEKKLEKNSKEIKVELEKVKKYKEDFFEAKEKIDKMNDDIEGFEEDYQKLVDRFKDDELANILVAANKEISSKIEERKRKIIKDKMAMNELVEKAELSKGKLVKLTAEKKALELCLDKILDAYEYYKTSIEEIINYSEEHHDDLSSKNSKIATQEEIDEIINDDIQEDDSEEETSDEINIDNEDVVNEVQEIETNDNNEDDELQEDNHTLAINEIPSEYTFNDDINLEDIIDFDDSIEDDEEIQEDENEE